VIARILTPLTIGAMLVVATAETGGVRAAVATTPTARTLLLGAVAAALCAGAVMAARPATRSLGAATWLAGVLALAPQWVGLEGTSDSARTGATLVAPLLPVALLHAVLALPDGSLQGRWRRATVYAAWAGGSVAVLLRALTRDPFLDPHCWPNCTVNTLLVRSEPALASGLGWALQWLAAACACAAFAACVRIRPLRAVAVAAVPTAALAALAYAALASPALEPGARHEQIAHVLVLLALLVLAAFGLWLATGPLRARLAVERIVHGSPGSAGLESMLRQALGDPALTMAYSLDDGALIDGTGSVLDPATFREGRSLTTIAGPSGSLALVAHGPTIAGFDRRLGAAARLAIDNERLAATLKLELARLASLRERIINVADSERRRIERNLHDGAQQHLVALALELGLASLDAARAPLAPAFEAVADIVDEALAELREVAHGIHPAVLDDGGLGPALAMLRVRTATPVAVLDELGPNRLPPDVEAVVYLVAAEALRNVDAHAAATRATVRLSRDEQAVRIAVDDDGRGGASVGAGLAELVDRVGALRGSLRVTNGPAGGTQVEAVMPCA
jgi:signal transduction histidine kinase